jgi:hypothetical protein
MFVHPPRPKQAIAPSLIPWYESRGYVAQVKKNGTCSVASVCPDRRVRFWTRDGDPHKMWTPTEEADRFFSGFADSAFCFELLHNKHPSVKDTVYVFDVVRWLGEDLVGKSFGYRQGLLSTIRTISPRIVMAKNYTECLLGLYESLADPVDEGLVLKDPGALLQPCYREGLNAGWQVKCRVRHKNYSF